MAEDAYIHAAASQLRDAISALQQEIHRIQSDAYSHEERLKAEISQAQYELENLEADLRARETLEHGQKKDEVQNRIRAVQSVLVQKKQAVGKQSSDAANVVNAKAGLQSKLQNLASQLDSLAASAR